MTGLTPPTRLSGRVLIVGASDASGSTGIQAAIKSISALGAFAAATVTAIVTDEVATSHEVPPLAVAAQLRMVRADIGADVLVIGGLANAGTVEAVADVLDGEARGIPVVLDLTDGTETPLLASARIVVAPSRATDLEAQKNAAAALARTAGAALVTSAAHGDVLADGAWSRRTITEIALRWGFEDAAHFSRRFTRKFGMNPKDFRKRSLAALPDSNA